MAEQLWVGGLWSQDWLISLYSSDNLHFAIDTIVVNRCARSTSRSFMGEQDGDGGVQEQDRLSLGIQVIINNSLGKG